jgi:hypothetical protein
LPSTLNDLLYESSIVGSYSSNIEKRKGIDERSNKRKRKRKKIPRKWPDTKRTVRADLPTPPMNEMEIES